MTQDWPKPLLLASTCSLALAALCSPTWAKDADKAPPADPVPTEPIALLESSRQQVRATTEWMARGVDSWFGNRPFEDGGKVSDGRLSLGLLHRQDQGTDLNVRFNVSLRLPNAEKFAYLFIGRDDQRDVVTDQPTAFSQQQRLIRNRTENESFVAGLGLNLPNSIDARIGFRGGLKPYAQVRYNKSWTSQGGLQTDFRETLFWAKDDRFGLTTALSLEQPLSPTLSLRWLGAFTVTQEAPKADASSVLGAYQSFGGQRLLSLEALLDAVQGSGVGLSDYGVQVKWEQPVYRQWLLAEFLAGHFWPRPDAALPRGRAWALGASLKMSF